MPLLAMTVPTMATRNGPWGSSTTPDRSKGSRAQPWWTIAATGTEPMASRMAPDTASTAAARRAVLRAARWSSATATRPPMAVADENGCHA